MKRFFTIVMIIMAVFSLNSCDQKKSDKDIISVSILPQKYFVEKIAGDILEVNVLIPPGASPAGYEPTPSQIISIEKSDLYLKIGYIGFEKAWMKRFKSANENLSVINTAKGADLIEDGGHWHGDHYHAGTIEPHVWTSPKTVTHIVDNIYHALIKQYPEHKSIFAENYKELKMEISELDGFAMEAFSDIKNNKFLIYHPALSYLARDYGLEQIAMEHQGKEPSSQYMKKLIDQAKEDSIRVVFIQKQFDQDNAKTLAKELDAEVITIDPLDENWRDNTKVIIGILAKNLK